MYKSDVFKHVTTSTNMSRTITEEPEKRWKLKDLSDALETAGGLLSNAERYKKERDEYKDLLERWETYAEALEQEIKDLKEVPYVETLERKIKDLETRTCKTCVQKAETNRRLLVALDSLRSVSSRTRSKTMDSRNIADDWAKSC